MTDQPQFEDADSINYSYFQKDKVSFRDIILQHLRKIAQLSCVEFRGGYWEERILPVAGGVSTTIKTYVPDSREVFSNGVVCFADMLFPYFDEEMGKAEQEARNKIRIAHEETTILSKPWEDEDDRNRPVQRTELEKKGYRIFKGQDDRQLYRDMRLEVNRELFRALCSFLYRKKYLDIGSIED